MTNEARLNEIIEKLNDLRPEGETSVWDKWKIVLSVLTPLAVVLVGVYFDGELDRRAAVKAERDDQLARLALIPDFMEALTGSDPARQVLAIRTVSKILPTEGRELLEGLVNSEMELSESAQAALRQEFVDPAALVEVNRIFSHIKSTRISAFERLISPDFEPREVIRATIYRMATDIDNSIGVYNALTLLLRYSGDQLQFAQSELARLIPKTYKHGPNTTGLADALSKKLK